VHPRHSVGLASRPVNEKPQTFQELGTKAHDMEVMIANRHGTSFGFVESKKDKDEFKRNVEFSKNLSSSLSRSELRESQKGKRKRVRLLRCNKETSHPKRALGEEISIP